MRVSLNGETIDCSGSTLMAIIREKGYDPSSLVAEVNLEVIRQENWDTFIIKDGDRIELLSFVGGG